MNRLSQLLNLRSGETGLVLTLGFVLFSNALAQKVSEISSLSNFLIDVGPPQFLVVLIVSSLISILMTILQSLLVDRFDRITLVRSISAILGASFIVLRLLVLFKAPSWLNYGLLYLMSDQQLIFFPTTFWILATDLFDIAQSKRVFSLLATVGLFGNLAGIAIASLVPFLSIHYGITTDGLLTINILLYGLIYGLLGINLRQVTLRKPRQKIETMQATISEGWNFVKQVAIFRYLTIAMLAVVVCEIIVEYRFYVVSGTAIPDTNNYQVFLSLFTLGRTLIHLVLQSSVVRWLMININLKHLFLFQPISSLVGAAMMLSIPGLGGAIAGLLIQKLPQYSVDETARKSLEGLVPEERRGRVSLFLDSYLIAGGTLFGAVITGIVVLLGERWGSSSYFYGYLAIAIAVSLFAIYMVLKMRTVYDSSLLNWRLKRRQRGKSVLDKIDL